jgi:hypothetical protein
MVERGWSTGQEGADWSTVGSKTGLLDSAGLLRINVKDIHV